MADQQAYTSRQSSPQTETMVSTTSQFLTSKIPCRTASSWLQSKEGLLAGKYKDAAELEKAYVELQKKLGTNDEAEDVEQTSATENETAETSLNDGANLITSANDEYYANDGRAIRRDFR